MPTDHTLSETAQSFPLGTYRHFKGDTVELIGVGVHSETEEELAIYEHDGLLWVRPLAMFIEHVEKPELPYSGPRFSFVESE